MGYLLRPQGQKQPVEATDFPRSVADMKDSEEEEEEQFIFLYHKIIFTVKFLTDAYYSVESAIIYSFTLSRC